MVAVHRVSSNQLVGQEEALLDQQAVAHKVHDLRPPAYSLRARARSVAQAQKSLCGAAVAVGAVLVGPDKKCLDRGGRGDALG